jgi:hypothetical protein
MSLSSKQTPKTHSLLIEGANGVTEYLVAIVDVNGTPVLGPIGARVASGAGSDLSLAELQEAIALHHWAEDHADVFREGRVVYPS